MPRRPGRPCRVQGCPRIDYGDGCPDHPRQPRPRYRRKDQRPSASKRGYSYKWQQYVKAYKRQHPICVLCDAPTYAVDHIQAVTGPDDSLFWEPSNHQSLCRSHHSIKTAQRDGGFGNPKGGGE